MITITLQLFICKNVKNPSRKDTYDFLSVTDFLEYIIFIPSLSRFLVKHVF